MDLDKLVAAIDALKGDALKKVRQKLQIKEDTSKPDDPDYEKKMVEWIKNRSGSIISINHEPIINSAGQLVHDIWAGLRFPVPLPIIGPEIKVPLVDENGNFSDVKKVELVNKSKEFEIDLSKDLFENETGKFRFPKNKSGLAAVIRSLLSHAVKRKIINYQ